MSDTEKKETSTKEIEIRLDADTPLSKKELRRIKKGKTTLEELQRKKAKKLAKAAAAAGTNATAATSTGTEKTATDGVTDGAASTGSADGAAPAAAAAAGSKRSDFGVWIGNLSFDTTRDELSNFVTSKADPPITKSDIARINLPTRGTKNRGFAYVDFFTEPHMHAAIALSESELNGRKVLIKNSKSYEGRPATSTVSPTASISKNPPSRILFVGNLSFDTTSELLQDHFKHCGEIVKIRVATFEDTGKCKGFAFIDFKDVEGPTAALKDKSLRKIIGRPLRMEFGEDRSQRKVIPKRALEDAESSSSTSTSAPIQASTYSYHDRAKGFQAKGGAQPYKRQQTYKPERMNSSIALASAQRQSAAIVKSTGKKIAFD